MHDTQSIKLFLPSGSSGTFNQAAEKMNITEPSLSRSIAALEDELGVILLKREAGM